MRLLCFLMFAGSALAADPAVHPAALLENPNLPVDLPRAEIAPPVQDGILPPIDKSPAPTASDVFTDFSLSHTYLPKTGNPGFGQNDTEFALAWKLPYEPLGKPLKLKLGSGIHFWDGPGPKLGRQAAPMRTYDNGSGFIYTMPDYNAYRPRNVIAGPDAGVPGTLYDLYADLGWRPRFAEWLFADLGLTPGLYGDFRTFPSDTFRLRGRALAIVATSERFQMVGGLLFINRNSRQIVPAGGILWKPSDLVDLQLVFPLPKASFRVAQSERRATWLYVAGEFGGGTWAYRRVDGTDGSLDSNDYRISGGIEWKRPDGWYLRAEAGFVFGRELLLRHGPEIELPNTLALRLAVGF
jgi:hypothetical protein